MRTIAIAITVVLAGRIGTAAADNCVDPAQARIRGGRPCMDVGSSFGGVDVMAAPGFADIRGQVFRIGLFGNDAGRRGGSVELLDWEAIDLDADGGLHFAWPFSGPTERTSVSVIGVRYQRDRGGWGAYVEGHVASKWYGDYRFLVPGGGVRVGRFDRAAVIADARLTGLALGGPMSVTRDVDVGLRTTLVVRPWLRLETRSRFRDVVTADQLHLRDVTAAIGVELAVAGKDGFRVAPVFVGLGVRRALVNDPAVAPADAPPVLERMAEPGAGAPWQLMLTVDLDFAINSSRAVW